MAPLRYMLPTYLALSIYLAQLCTAVLGSSVAITGRQLRMTWTNDTGSWTANLQSRNSSDCTWTRQSSVMGQYSLLANYTSSAQSKTQVERGELGNLVQFGADSVSLANSSSSSNTSGVITTTSKLANGVFTATWWVDTSRSWDLLAVNATWEPTAAGWFSIPSPRLVDLEDDDLGWGVVPGYWSSNGLESSNELVYGYVQGVPTGIYVSLEASTTSLVSILSSKSTGTTYAVIAHPSLARDPFANNNATASQGQWNVGLSLRSANGTLSPTAYYPVLGQAYSQMAPSSSVTACFLYAVVPGNDTHWYEVNRFVHQEVYPLSEYASRAVDLDSLSNRINRIHDFMVTPSSKWHLWTYENLTMGAESGKLSDVAAMWMLQHITGDPLMLDERLPYARNFKLAQQDTSGDDAFHGAALGEYFKDGAFVSELVWVGSSSPDYVSPIFTTFYLLSDIGNILLFNSTDELLYQRFQLAAEKLLSWQQSNGSFNIGYLKSNPSTLKYPELSDNRATWYGLLAAYRILKNTTYLDAAEAGAQWFINTAVAKGRWLGVCDDTLLYPDFATGHAAGALLELYELTGKSVYLDAAVQTAKFYTLHIFNHPVVDDSVKQRNGQALQDWQLSQVALSYEHAGYGGSVNTNGPITISSHAGLFIRIFEATGDDLFLQLARLAARGRDAFVTPNSGIPSYYWKQGNTGGSTFPWHGWWHIGWLTDYLISSAHMSSGGDVSFPHGFMAAKVGSHVPYGFATGTVYGTAANLWQPHDLVNVSDPNVDYITARSTDGARLFVILLNQVTSGKHIKLTLDPRSLIAFKVATWGDYSVLAGGPAPKTGSNTWSVDVAGAGMSVLSIDTTLANDPQGPSFRTFTVAGEASKPTVSWSFWTNVKSWAEWAVPGSGVWTPMPASTNYTFSASLDLSNVTVDQIKIRIRSQVGSYVGVSNATYWTIS